MPFIERQVEPRYLSRTSLNNPDGSARIRDEELLAVNNCTLTNAIRQLASLVLVANDMFNDLTSQLKDVADKSHGLHTKIVRVSERVGRYDPKTVTVPEGTLSDFATCKVHYNAKHPQATELFTNASRPLAVKVLYEQAARKPLETTCLEDLRRDVLPFFTCTPVLGARYRKNPKYCDIDIETRTPAAVEDLRKWTSKEAIGEVSALTDASVRVMSGITLTPDELSEVDSGDDEPVDHKLPSPEEQLEVIVNKFAPELVRIDTSGRFFDRMCQSRKSLTHIETNGETDTVKRRSRPRKPRGKRRNTISGTDQKELREAIAGESANATAPQEGLAIDCPTRSKSGDLLSPSPPDLTVFVKKPNHFDSLKRWSRTKFKSIAKTNSLDKPIKVEEITQPSFKIEKVDDSPPKVTSTIGKRRKSLIRTHERTPSYSSSEAGHIPIRYRDRRLRRAKTEEEPHSSSGNWSASSESGRTSLTSEARTKQGDVSSEGTLTPEVAHDDLETGSEYSCDTEGYYTSFHVDSGLKTLKEEEPSNKTKQETDYELFGRGSTSTTASSAGTVCTVRAASERDLSAPPPPERASSLNERKYRSSMPKSPNSSDSIRAYIASKDKYLKKNAEDIYVKTYVEEKGRTSPILEAIGRGSSSPDSGHNTSSSPIEDSLSSAAGKRTPSEKDYSSCSDLEGADRTERIRTKVAINSDRIPSMCVITPAASDDEGSVRSMAPVPMAIKVPNLMPLSNFVGRLKGVLPTRLTKRKSPHRPAEPLPDEEFDAGEYVTIADVENNNKKVHTYDACKNLRAVLTGDLETEYVSLNELPDCTDGAIGSVNNLGKIGAKVTLDSEGKVIYSSDSLRRRNDAHSTFEPGPYVNVVTPTVPCETLNKPPLSHSPQMKRFVIKAPTNPFEKSTTDIISMPLAKPVTIISPTKNVARITPNQQRHGGALINIHDAEGVSLSPSKDETKDPHCFVADTSQEAVAAQCDPKGLNIPQSYRDSAFRRDNPMFWTMQPKRVVPDLNYVAQRSATPEFDSPLKTFSSTINRPIIKQPIKLQPVTTTPIPESFEETIKISPIDPRQDVVFKSSTPSKDNIVNFSQILSPVRSTMSNEELYAVIHKSKKKLNIKDSVDRAGSPALSNFSLSPVSSESSLSGRLPAYKAPESGYLKSPLARLAPLQSERSDTPTHQSPRPSTCSDRYGPSPQTSRMDFKRLLLQHGVKLSQNNSQKSNKVSAVELLKVSKDKVKPNPLPSNSNLSQLNILDLSGSPKIYNHRKFVRFQQTSPNRNNNKSSPKTVLSPKTQWKFASPRSDVLSTPIPEAHNEDDVSNSSSDKTESSKSSTVTINSSQGFGARRVLIPVDERISISEADSSLNISNPFKRCDQGNRTEVSPRAELQNKRAQFFSAPSIEPTPPLLSFKNPFNRMSPSMQIDNAGSSDSRSTPSPPALETAL